MEKIFSIVALSCALSIIYQSKILPYHGSFISFMVLVVGGLFAMILFYKLMRLLAKMAFAAISAMKSFSRALKAMIVSSLHSLTTLPARLSNKKMVLHFLLRRNSRLSFQIESLKAELDESSSEIKNMVSNWSPKISKDANSSARPLKIQPATADLHMYNFIENAKAADTADSSISEKANSQTSQHSNI